MNVSKQKENKNKKTKRRKRRRGRGGKCQNNLDRFVFRQEHPKTPPFYFSKSSLNGRTLGCLIEIYDSLTFRINLPKLGIDFSLVW